jgi:hypothetical protein
LATEPSGFAGSDYIKYWATLLPLIVAMGHVKEKGVYVNINSAEKKIVNNTTGCHDV